MKYAEINRSPSPILLCLMLATLSCAPNSKLVEQDMRWIKLEKGYTVEAFLKDAADVRNSKWPDHSQALGPLFERAKWEGTPRDAVLRLLGPADGELDFREVPVKQSFEIDGKIKELMVPEKKPYLVPPDDDRLIYRTGDGYNHGPFYTVFFRDGRVSKVEIMAGY